MYARPWRFKENEATQSNNKEKSSKGDSLPSRENVEERTAALFDKIQRPPQTPLDRDLSDPGRKRQRESPLNDDVMPNMKVIAPQQRKCP